MFAREGQDTIKPLWNKGSGVLSKGREEVANKSLLGSCHSGVHANDMEIGCFFCSGSIFPGLIHTISRTGLDPRFGMINHSSAIPQPWPLLTANLSPRLTATSPQELKLITDFKTQRF